MWSDCHNYSKSLKMSQREGGRRRRRRRDRNWVGATRCIRNDRPLNWACLHSHPDWKYLNAATSMLIYITIQIIEQKESWAVIGSLPWQQRWAVWSGGNVQTFTQIRCTDAWPCFSTWIAFAKRGKTKCHLHVKIKLWSKTIKYQNIIVMTDYNDTS